MSLRSDKDSGWWLRKHDEHLNLKVYHVHRCMVMRRTGGMAYGSILRVIGIYACAQLFFSSGWLSHISATFILLLGFVIEAAIARISSARAANSKWPRINPAG